MGCGEQRGNSTQDDRQWRINKCNGHGMTDNGNYTRINAMGVGSHADSGEEKKAKTAMDLGEIQWRFLKQRRSYVVLTREYN